MSFSHEQDEFSHGESSKVTPNEPLDVFETEQDSSDNSSSLEADDGLQGSDLPDLTLEWQAKVVELEDRLLRVHADFDNFRRRTRQEKEELLSVANAKMAGELLPVLDNLQLALQASQTTGESASIAKGVDMVFKQIYGLLENLGLRVMDPVGESFDPNLHEAVMSESSAEYEPGKVIAVLRTGYFFKDKVLRAAMVKVSE